MSSTGKSDKEEGEISEREFDSLSDASFIVCDETGMDSDGEDSPIHSIQLNDNPVEYNNDEDEEDDEDDIDEIHLRLVALKSLMKRTSKEAADNFLDFQNNMSDFIVIDEVNDEDDDNNNNNHLSQSGVTENSVSTVALPTELQVAHSNGSCSLSDVTLDRNTNGTSNISAIVSSVTNDEQTTLTATCVEMASTAAAEAAAVETAAVENIDFSNAESTAIAQSLSDTANYPLINATKETITASQLQSTSINDHNGNAVAEVEDEDDDEDILRAYLLASVSSKIAKISNKNVNIVKDVRSIGAGQNPTYKRPLNSYPFSHIPKRIILSMSDSESESENDTQKKITNHSELVKNKTPLAKPNTSNAMDTGASIKKPENTRKALNQQLNVLPSNLSINKHFDEINNKLLMLEKRFLISRKSLTKENVVANSRKTLTNHKIVNTNSCLVKSNIVSNKLSELSLMKKSKYTVNARQTTFKQNKFKFIKSPEKLASQLKMKKLVSINRFNNRQVVEPKQVVAVSAVPVMPDKPVMAPVAIDQSTAKLIDDRTRSLAKQINVSSCNDKLTNGKNAVSVSKLKETQKKTIKDQQQTCKERYLQAKKDFAEAELEYKQLFQKMKISHIRLLTTLYVLKLTASEYQKSSDSREKSNPLKRKSSDNVAEVTEVADSSNSATVTQSDTVRENERTNDEKSAQKKVRISQVCRKSVKEVQSKVPYESPLDLHNNRKIDPKTPLCPFDLTGVCNDSKCAFQHLN